MSIVRGYAYVPHEPGARTDDGYWMELAGTQAKVVKDFLNQSYIQSRKLARVPTYKLDRASVYSARKAKPVKAHLFLSCHVNVLGALLCSHSNKRFDKRIRLVVWPNKPMRLVRFMPQGTEIMKQFPPHDNDEHYELEINLIDFSFHEELIFGEELQESSSPSISRSGSSDILPTDFTVYRDTSTRSIAVQTEPERNNNSTILIESSQEEIPSTSTREDQDSSLLGAILVSEDTGQVSRVARPSNPLPTPLFSFQPLATSTEEVPGGPSKKGKSATGRGKSSGAAKAGQSQGGQEDNQQDEAQDKENSAPIDVNIRRNPVHLSVNVAQEDGAMMDIGQQGQPAGSMLGLRSPPSGEKAKTPRQGSTRRKTPARKKRPHRKVQKIMVREIRPTSSQVVMDKYLNKKTRMFVFKRTARARTPRPETPPASKATTSTATPPGANSTLPTPPNTQGQSEVSPIPLRLNVTIPLPESSTSPSRDLSSHHSSSAHNSKTSNDARDFEPASVIFGSPPTGRPNEDPERVINIEDEGIETEEAEVDDDEVEEIVPISYETPMRKMAMPPFPDPTWKDNPVKKKKDDRPEHVVLEAHAEINTVFRRVSLRKKHDPWQILEALRTHTLIPDEDEEMQTEGDAQTNDQVIVYEDPILQEYPFPEPVPSFRQATSSNQADPKPGPSGTQRKPLQQIDLPPSNRPLPILDDSRFFSDSNPSSGSRLILTPETTASSLTTTSGSSNNLVIDESGQYISSVSRSMTNSNSSTDISRPDETIDMNIPDEFDSTMEEEGEGGNLRGGHA